MDKQEVDNQFWDLINPIIAEYDENEITVNALSTHEGIRYLADRDLDHRELAESEKRHIMLTVAVSSAVKSEIVEQAYFRCFDMLRIDRAKPHGKKSDGQA